MLPPHRFGAYGQLPAVNPRPRFAADSLAKPTGAAPEEPTPATTRQALVTQLRTLRSLLDRRDLQVEAFEETHQAQEVSGPEYSLARRLQPNTTQTRFSVKAPGEAQGYQIELIENREGSVRLMESRLTVVDNLASQNTWAFYKNPFHHSSSQVTLGGVTIPAEQLRNERSDLAHLETRVKQIAEEQRRLQSTPSASA